MSITSFLTAAPWLAKVLLSEKSQFYQYSQRLLGTLIPNIQSMSKEAIAAYVAKMNSEERLKLAQLDAEMHQMLIKAEVDTELAQLDLTKIDMEKESFFFCAYRPMYAWICLTFITYVFCLSILQSLGISVTIPEMYSDAKTAMWSMLGIGLLRSVDKWLKK